MATLSNLVQRCVTRLSMVNGVAVQVYAEDRLAEMIWHKFVMVRDELWWDEFMDYVTLTQDVNGRPTELVVRELPISPLGTEIVINKFNDIQLVWHPDRRDPIKDIQRRSNPTAIMRAGTTLYKYADQEKVIRFGAIEVGVGMIVRYKKHYAYFNPDDIVPMDEQLLISGAVYDYLEDDGANPGQTEKFRNFFNDRLRQLKAQENDREIPLSPSASPNSSGYQTL